MQPFEVSVCNLNLFKLRSQDQVATFHEALEIHNEVLKHLSRISSILNYPYKIKPHCDFVNEISQLKVRHLHVCFLKIKLVENK